MISGIFTALAFLAFIGVTAWAYAPHNRRRFEEAAALPLTGDERPAGDRGEKK
ncbi:MAG: CcoQ/FixQ family Cbb3-type cytochrome c oxidase assembly chaperone [Gammaproteobacteria bacterium]|nr:CcoQ/FixQ family Cbb3-type cytochrome c oxidase assembly chaperone [Gammaproteobacteria bacterium]